MTPSRTRDAAALTHDHLIVHCSATRASDDIDAGWIDRLHKAFGWQGIGYNFVITRDGTVQPGRPLTRPGAHVGDCNAGAWRNANWNARSIGVCLAGGVAPDGRTPEDNYTPAQRQALRALIEELWSRAPAIGREARTMGHRDLIKLTGAPAKACPCFSVKSWLAVGGADTPDRDIDADLARREATGSRATFTAGAVGLVRESLRGLTILPPGLSGLLGIAERALSPATHRIRSGDTLWSVSRLYGVPLADLIATNAITDPDGIPVGTILRIYR